MIKSSFFAKKNCTFQKIVVPLQANWRSISVEQGRKTGEIRNQMKIKDLKIAYNVLSELDHPVPTDLLVHVAQRIREQESATLQRRIARMTEEQLIWLDNKQKRILKIYLPDGRMIQKTNAKLTFREAIREVGVEQVADLDLRMGHRKVILYDDTMKRRRIKNYYFIQPGYFLLDNLVGAERLSLLSSMDQLLHLNWEIEWV